MRRSASVMGTAATASSAVARRTASPSPSPSSSVLPPIRRRAASAMEMARGGEPEPEPEPRQRTGVGACPGPGVERLIEMAMGDVAPDLRPALQAVPCVRQAVVLQCVYYAHMFFVLRERAIKRRIRLEKKRKRTLSATFAGAEERQDAYLAKREAMMKQFGLDNAGEAEAQQVAQIDALIGTLQDTLAKQGKDVRVGIIGGGRIGTTLLEALLHCGTFSPERIRVSTRRPEQLLSFQAQGVVCEYDNAMVASCSEVLFLCCLPAHLPRVAKEMTQAGSLSRPQLLVVSCVGGCTADKVQNLLGIGCVLRPIIDPVTIAAQITASSQAAGTDVPTADFAAGDAGAMVEVASAQISSEKQNIYTILFALQRWCEALDLPVKEARQIALFCIVGDPERGSEPLEMFRRRFLWTLRNLPDLLSSQTERGLAIKAELSTVEDLHKDDAAPPPRRARTRPGAETKP